MAKQTTKTGHGRGELRGTPRRSAALEAEAPLGDGPRRVQVANISAGGLMFSTRAPAHVPASMDLRLALPSGEEITLTGSVRHVARRPGSDQVVDIGVQFAGLDADQRRALDTALASLLPG